MNFAAQEQSATSLDRGELSDSLFRRVILPVSRFQPAGMMI